MPARHYNLVSTLLGADISNVATTITFTLALQEGGVNVPTLSGGDYIWLKVEDELMKLTAYTAGALSGTVSRGQGDTAAAFHSESVTVGVVATKEDFDAGGGAGVILVAATDSSATAKIVADYVCDGTADQTEINAALAAASAEGGGVVELFPGNYTITATIAFSMTNDVTMRAASQSPGLIAWSSTGSSEVWINRDGVSNYPAITRTGSQGAHAIEGIAIYDSGADANTSALISYQSTSGYPLVLRRCYVENSQGTGIDLAGASSNNLILEECDIQCSGNAIAASAKVVYMTASDCNITGYSSTGISLLNLAGGSFVRLLGCSDYGSSAVSVRIDGNSASTPMPIVEISGGQYLSANEGIYLTECLRVSIQDVMVGKTTTDSAIRMDNVDGGIISGVIVPTCGHHGMWLNDVDDMLIVGNYLNEYGVTTDNTYSGILLDGNSNRNQVLSNHLRSQATNKALYGIRIDDSTCDDNLVEGNDLLGSAKTNGNEFSDAGTGTRGWKEMELAYFPGTIAITTGKQRKRFTRPAILGLSYANIDTAPTGSTAIADVNKNGTTIYSTTGNRPTISISAFSNTPTALPDTKYMAADDYLTTDIDQVGSTIAGADLTIMQRYMPI